MVEMDLGIMKCLTSHRRFLNPAPSTPTRTLCSAVRVLLVVAGKCEDCPAKVPGFWSKRSAQLPPDGKLLPCCGVDEEGHAEEDCPSCYVFGCYTSLTTCGSMCIAICCGEGMPHVHRHGILKWPVVSGTVDALLPSRRGCSSALPAE